MSSLISRTPRSARPEPTLKYGDELGAYLINGFAGVGATSYVYRARKLDSFEPVAVKILHPHLIEDDVKRRRFIREAEMMMRFRHPNIVRFHEIVDLEDGLAFVMEYIDGETLEEWMASAAHRADERTLACLFVDILRGLNHAHRHGVVHRDLKPANILITRAGDRYVAKIIDFGVARYSDQPTPAEDKSKIVGTAAYISPEEVRDPDTVCQASDLYSVGVMMYEAACGQRPFEGMPVRDLMDAHAHQAPERPSHVNPALTPAFESVILRALTKTPEERYESAPELIGALEMAIRGALQVPQGEAAEEQPTTEFSRALSQGDQGEEVAGFLAFFRQALLMAMTLMLTSGHQPGPHDPHYANRHPGVDLPIL